MISNIPGIVWIHVKTRERFFPSCHERARQRKNSESPWGIEPLTFGFRALTTEPQRLHGKRTFNIVFLILGTRILACFTSPNSNCCELNHRQSQVESKQMYLLHLSCHPALWHTQFAFHSSSLHERTVATVRAWCQIHRPYHHWYRPNYH